MDALDRVGLCRTCVHSRQVKSARGSVFWLCRKSETDPRFAKYPALPMVRCPGYEIARGEPGTGNRDR